jgi:carbamoyltransferase
MTKYYIGVSALHHDSAACIVDSVGNIIGISQEERRTNTKNDKSWPKESITWCLQQTSMYDIESNDVEYGFYEHVWSKFLRRIYQNPKGIVKYFKESYDLYFNKTKGYKRISHHTAHALAGCATAPFEKGVFLTIDAIGEWETTTWGTFDQKSGIYQDGAIKYPHSIGLLYSSFTRWLGLKPNEDEYMIMGAAAHGKPIYAEKIFSDFIKIKKNGTYELKVPVHNGIEQYLGYDVPASEWYDWCASIQKVCEEIVLHLILMLQKKYGKGFNLVFGGGVALNCVVNSYILTHPDVSINDIWILPSPGDGGTALGAAAYAAGLMKLNWDTPFLGKDIDHHSQPTQVLIRDVVGRLERGEIIGWIQGNEEFGPRALGHRSLLADPRLPNMKDKINAIKRRQDFRPFAVSILEEEAVYYVDLPCKPERCRYMQFTARVRNPEFLPAICHIDYTTRVQTVPKSTNSLRRLLDHWKRSTGCAALLNTSLNVKGSPIINDRKHAIQMLLNTPMDALIIGNRLYYKEMHAGISDNGDPTEIINSKDYSYGADSLAPRQC